MERLCYDIILQFLLVLPMLLGHSQFVRIVLMRVPSYWYFAVAGLLRGLNVVLKSSCFTNHALCNFHSFVGSASCTCDEQVKYQQIPSPSSRIKIKSRNETRLTSNLLKKLGTNL